MYKLRIHVIVALFVLSIGCKKVNEPTPPIPESTYTTGIGGMRNWHGHHYYSASGPSFPAPIHEDRSLPDTSFAITIIDDTTVSCMTHTFTYHSSDSVEQIHFFGMAQYNYLYGGGKGEGIAYHYAIDSIVYFKAQDSHGTRDMWHLDDRYYTY